MAIRFRHKTATRRAAPSSNLDFRKDFGEGECTAARCAGGPHDYFSPSFFFRSTKILGMKSRLRYSLSARNRDLQPLRCYRNHHPRHLLPHGGKRASPISANNGSCLLPPRDVRNAASWVLASVPLTLHSIDSERTVVLSLRQLGADLGTC